MSSRHAGTGRPGAGKTALTNVRVFDGQGLRPPGTVVIDGDWIGTGPAGAQIVDGAGGAIWRASEAARPDGHPCPECRAAMRRVTGPNGRGQ